MSAYTNLGAIVSKTRPLSAANRRKSCSKNRIVKKGRGLGYFGDDNDTIRQ